MRAPLLPPPPPLLLLLLLLGVRSQDVTKISPGQGENRQSMTTYSSMTKGANPTTSPGHPSSPSTRPPTAVQVTTSISKPGNSPLTTVLPSTAVRMTTLTSQPGQPPSTPERSPTTVQGATPTKHPGDPPLTPTTSPRPSQQVSSSTSSADSKATTAAISSATQQASPAASLGSSAATTTRSLVLTHGRSTSASPGGLGIAVTSPPSSKAQASQPSDQLTSSTASTGVPRNTSSPGLKDFGVSSPTYVTKQPHSSSSSPDQGLSSSTTSGSTNTSVTRSVFHTTAKASLPLPPGSTDKVSGAATTLTPGADQRSHDARSASTKPASADQSPTSAQTSAPAPGDQRASSSPGHPPPSASFHNEVICKDQVQNNRPTIYLKEAKTCAEWRTASANASFFESFCSTGQHAFNASRETCMVTLTSDKPRSQHWTVQAVVYLPLDPDKILEELQKKDKLQELGIANVTYDNMERELIINDEFSTPLIITIVTLAGSLLLIAAIYGCCHQRFSQKKDQHIHPDVPGFDDGHVALIFNQRLTEELQTMENGYHDNPTLEVMETSSEMQEKKVNLNGELGDSWIVPLDTLMKEDLEEEEDTHL